jgi:hypothetical protein
VDYFIYFILVLSTLFQSLSTFNSLGVFGTSLSGIITPFMCIGYILLCKGSKKIVVSKYTKNLFILLFYLVIVNMVILIVYFFVFNNSVYILGENFFIKTLKANYYFVSIILFVLVIENVARNFSVKRLILPFVYGYYLLFSVLIFEKTSPALFNKLFHAGMDYNRIRLLTTESSYTGTLIIVFFALSFYYYTISKQPIFRVISIFILAAFIISSGSKGFILNFIVALAFFAIFKSGSIRNRLVIIFTLVGIVVFVLPTIQRYLIEDINSYTSFATRFFTIYCSVKYFLVYPFGTGTALYLEKFPKLLLDNLNIMMDYRLNAEEVLMYIYATSDEFIGSKSGVLQWAMYWGIFGTVFLAKYLLSLYKDMNRFGDKDNFILAFGLVFLVLSIVSYVSFDVKYEIWAFFAIISLLNKNHEIIRVA